MAEIYTKLSDKTLILAPREAFIRQFNFGTDWTEMRLGLFFTGVDASGDNTDSSAESVPVASASDRITVGIKDAGTADLPGYGSSLFMGAMTATAATNISSSTSFLCSGTVGNALVAGGFAGTTLVSGTNATEMGFSMNFGAASGATGYNGSYILKFVVNNIGLSSQSVTISSRSEAIVGTDYSETALRTLMNNAIFGTARTINWNDGVSARVIPDCVFIRVPFFLNRIRLSAIRAIRYLP